MIWRSVLLAAISIGSLQAVQPTPQPALHTHRESQTDLEITGLTAQPRFVSRDFLATLPQVTAAVTHDENFPELTNTGITVSGIYLEVLAKALGADPTAAIEAICTDGYDAPYPPAYTNTHRPIFALTIDGMTPHDWAAKTHAYDSGPYFITYDNFKPAFKVLSHTDRAQVPSNITRLNFTTEADLYAAITPRTKDPVINQGFRIAQQNCFRCHNAASHGGTKAGHGWTELAQIAKHRPGYFDSYIHEPKSVAPKSTMPPNPQYDQATLSALTRYFQTFAAPGP